MAIGSYDWVIIVDTGPLVAITDADDGSHRRCLDALGAAEPPLIVPVTVLAEVCYMLERSLGPTAEAAFLRSFEDGSYVLQTVTPSDLSRVAELVETYADMPLGAVDASVIAIAERLGVPTVATLDRRDFSVVRPRHVETLTLVPE